MPPRAATLPLLLISGEWKEARELAEITRADGSPLERHMAATVLGYLSRNQGRRDQAWAMVREILPRGPASQPEDTLFPQATAMFRLAAWLSIDAGNSSEAGQWLEAHERWLDWSGAERGRVEVATLQSAINLLVTNVREAEECARCAIALASDPYQPMALIDAELMLARILGKRDDIVEAIAHCDRALTLARACSAPFERAQCEIELVSLYHQSGTQPDTATRLLEEAESRATRIEAVPLLQRIDHLRTNPGPKTGIGLLSDREIEVLRAVADGMTDAEAAKRLFISPRTVSQHLRSIYNKLGVSSRTAATRLAVEHGIL